MAASSSASSRIFTPSISITPHYAANLIVSYLDPREETLSGIPFKFNIINVMFTNIDLLWFKAIDVPSWASETITEIPRLPNRYSFRVIRAMQALAKTRSKTEELSREVIEKYPRWLFNNSTQHLYRDLYDRYFCRDRLKILVPGVVWSDGMGDYGHMNNGAAQLQAAFSKSTVILGTEVQDLAKRRDKFSPCTFPQHVWEYNRSEDEQAQKCAHYAKTADLVVEISNLVTSNTSTREMAQAGATNYSRCLEYAKNAADPEEAPMSHSIADCGMGPGIFSCGFLWTTLHGEGEDLQTLAKILKESGPKVLVNVLQEQGVKTLKDETLKGVLLDPSFLPTGCTDQNIGYYQTHDLHYSYTPNFMPRSTNGWVLTQLRLDQHSRKPFIDLIFTTSFTSKKEGVESFSEEKVATYFAWLKNRPECAGIKEVHIVQKSKSGAILCCKSPQYQAEGKVLRLFSSFHVPNLDVLRLTACAIGPIGCMGDVSFSEVILLTKVPYYIPAIHSRRVLRAFLDLAAELFPARSPLVNYLCHLRTEEYVHPYSPMSDDEEYTERDLVEMDRLFQDPQLHLEMGILSEYLREFYNFNEVLIDIASKMLSLTKVPHLKALEEALFDAYISGKKSLIECHEELKNYMSGIARLERA